MVLSNELTFNRNQSQASQVQALGPRDLPHSQVCGGSEDWEVARNLAPLGALWPLGSSSFRDRTEDAGWLWHSSLAQPPNTSDA